jgi:hypothetical protein
VAQAATVLEGTVTGYHVEWTVSVPLRDDELDAAIDAVLDSLADLDDPAGVHDVDCGAALGAGTVEFSGYVAASTVDDACRRFTSVLREVLAGWPGFIERSVRVEAPEPIIT